MNDEWRTPKPLFEELNAEFNFDYDVCANPENALAPFKGDYFENDFENCVCWMNPPYSNPAKFVERAIALTDKKVITVALLRSDTSTRLFHRLYKEYEIRFVEGRIHFIDKEGKRGGQPNFSSMLVIIRRLTWRRMNNAHPL